MREFSKVSPNVWQSKRYNSLPSLEGRHLYLYLLTSEHQTSAGAYRLPDGYATFDLSWDLPLYLKARQELASADMIVFDEATSEVMITRWFKHNPPMSPSHFIGVEKLLKRLQSQLIWEEASQAAHEAWEAVQVAKLAKTNKSGKALASASYGQQETIPSRLQTPFMTRGQE